MAHVGCIRRMRGFGDECLWTAANLRLKSANSVSNVLAQRWQCRLTMAYVLRIVRLVLIKTDMMRELDPLKEHLCLDTVIVSRVRCT